jgi:hypothetical protein
MATNPVPPPPPRSNAILWILGILGAGAVIIVLIGLATAFYVAHHVRATSSGSRVEITTPVGQIKVNEGASHDTGLPVYPGASEMPTEGANLEIVPAGGPHVGVAAAQFFTTDPLDKVVAWYAEQLGPGFSREAPGRRMRRMQTVSAGDADVAYVSDNGDLIRLVALKKKASGVEIGLARFGKQEVQ